MKTSFELTMDDWMAFQKNHLSTSKQYNRSKTISVWMVPMVFMAIPIMELLQDNPNYYLMAIFIGLSVLWLVFYPKRFENRTLNGMKKMIEEGDNSSLLGTHCIELSDEGFTVTEPGSEQKYKWSAINKVAENEDYIFIYVSSISACIIPKFKIEQGKEEFLNFIRLKTN